MSTDRSVTLVQSTRYANIWSLQGPGEGDWRTFRDPMFRSGAMAAENAVLYAREHGLRITEVVSVHTGIDGWEDVIAGIETRTGRPVIDPEGGDHAD